MVLIPPLYVYFGACWSYFSKSQICLYALSLFFPFSLHVTRGGECASQLFRGSTTSFSFLRLPTLYSLFHASMPPVSPPLNTSHQDKKRVSYEEGYYRKEFGAGSCPKTEISMVMNWMLTFLDGEFKYIRKKKTCDCVGPTRVASAEPFMVHDLLLFRRICSCITMFPPSARYDAVSEG